MSSNGFPSLNPPNRLSFNLDRDLQGVFYHPIYMLNWELSPISTQDHSDAWIEVTPQNTVVSYFESPITFSVKPHNFQGIDAVIRLVNTENNDIVHIHTIDNISNNTPIELKFHVGMPGRYRLEASHTLYPSDTVFTVKLTWFYGLCILASAIGVVCRQQPSSLKDRRFAYGLLEGIVFSVVVAFSITYLRYSVMPEINTDWNLINAIFYGLTVGYFAPFLVHDVLLSRLRDRVAE